jgi:hypothetical protein
LEFSGSPAKNIAGIDIYSRAAVQLPQLQATLYLTGAGLLKKDQVFFPRDYYVAAHYLNTTIPIDEAQPLVSIKNATVRAIQLTVLADTNAQEIRAHLQMGLIQNGINLDTPAIQRLLGKFNEVLPARTTITFVGGVQDDGSELLAIEIPNLVVQEQAVDLAMSFWKVWFGVPYNAHMKELKTALIRSTSSPKKGEK